MEAEGAPIPAGSFELLILTCANEDNHFILYIQECSPLSVCYFVTVVLNIMLVEWNNMLGTNAFSYNIEEKMYNIEKMYN